MARGELNGKRDVASRRGECILVAVAGFTPAVLTETIWALASESPPVRTDRLVALTTTAGAKVLRRVFFDEARGWQAFARGLERDTGVSAPVFGDTPDCIREIPSKDRSHALPDITSREHSEAAADFILETVRQFTANPDTRVVASLAGGRKTMGALLTSCMTLLGREQDRLCHVLVAPPFDQPL